MIITSSGKPRAVVTAISEEDFEGYLLETSSGLQDMLAEATAEYHAKGGVLLDDYLAKRKRKVDKFDIILSPHAMKDMDSFSDIICAKIVSSLEALRETPFPEGKLIKKIKDKNADLYRLRADKHRVFYVIEFGKVVVLRILSKKEADRLN